MKRKKWLLVLIIAFPSFFWLILETSTINSRKLPYYGPKVSTGGTDTIYHTVPAAFEFPGDPEHRRRNLERNKFPLYAIVFINEKYREDAYRLTGLWEYLNYKKEKVGHIPFILVTPRDGETSGPYEELKKLSSSNNVHFYTLSRNAHDSLVKLYFKEKPYYIDYSFFMLVDANRNIRGYYDGRYVSELKRLIEEYKHLRLKEEKQILIDQNEIKKNP